MKKNHLSVKTKSVGNNDFYLMLKLNAACSNEFFLWRVDYTSEGKRFD